jgi:hypothetical protein
MSIVLTCHIWGENVGCGSRSGYWKVRAKLGMGNSIMRTYITSHRVFGSQREGSEYLMFSDNFLRIGC